jgi:YegS/Rv2252/BmrU family lipid kinase
MCVSPGQPEPNFQRSADVLVLANPVCLARHALTLDDVIARFATHDLLAEGVLLKSDWAMRDLRAAIEAGGYNMVVAAGGDGTVHQVANALIGLGRPMGVLPLGTANDFARTLGLSGSLDEAVRVIAESAPLPIDVARVNQVYFLNAAHVGLGVETAKRTNLTLKKVIGPIAYVLAAAQAWLDTEPMPIQICIEDSCLNIQAAQLLVGNGRYYGGGNVVAPDATLDDGLLDVYVLSADVSKTELLSLAAAARRGTLGDQPHIMYYRTARLSASLVGPVQINVDGEVLAMEGRLEFEVLPRALGVYAPATPMDPAWVPGALFAKAP